MPRIPKPFRWRDGWYTDAGGRRARLLDSSATFTAAQAELRKRVCEQHQNDGHPRPRITIAELFAVFLDAVKVENEPATYDQYQRALTAFAKLYGGRQASSLTALDAQDYKKRLVNAVCPKTKKPYKPRTINSALIALKRCWNWAIHSEALGLTKNPFRQVKLLSERGRQRIATDKEFQALLRHSDALFRQVLLCFRYLPIRPQDLRTLQWYGENYVDFDNHAWVIQKDKSIRAKKDKQPKIVIMPLFIEKLLRWRRQRSVSSYVFVNEDGRPWRKDALVLRMRRLRQRAGIGPDANGEQMVLYTNRHTCLTRAATVMTASELQALAGHTDYRTTRKYVHLAQQQKILANLSRRAVDALHPQKSPGK